MTAAPLVTILTPVYNGAEYLRECIESVLAQTYGHFEYVIVNNCSTDGTLDIAREYARRDRRIRIHNNERFVRVAENYNIAFRQMSPQSKYCKPVASDDLLLPECVERMISVAEAHPTVGIVGAHGLYSEAERGVSCNGVPYGTPVVPGRVLGRAYLLEQGPAVFGSATFLLYLSDLLRSRYAFFNESEIHSDSEASLEAMERYDFGFVHQILTFTRVRAGSLTSLSQDINTYQPYRLYVVQRYGPKYLTRVELQRQTRQCLRHYYDYLGRQVGRRRGKDFWKFHRAKLAAVGRRLSRARLAAAVLRRALLLALNPQASAAKLARRLRRGRSISSGSAR